MGRVRNARCGSMGQCPNTARCRGSGWDLTPRWAGNKRAPEGGEGVVSRWSRDRKAWRVSRKEGLLPTALMKLESSSLSSVPDIQLKLRRIRRESSSHVSPT
ncbi:uncharacterized protein LOC121979213 [Zingiber officinale]|uniref:uncharacterized protein LOC121979213 n=1 Tax=Zingiber officinale TaxID=94328 RepID=UPI001C4CDDAB|nr:uncharacterized protein LOC121979213 [Zingiber officinale]